MRYVSLLILTIFSFGFSYAQPDWAKKSAKAVFSLKTFNADGELIGSCNGFFIDDNGTAITSYTPFIGAVRAVAYNSKGKEMNVECILGANETYDVMKVKIVGKDIASLPVASASPAVSTPLWLLPYTTGKKITCEEGDVDKVEKFNTDYEYYTLRIKAAENTVGCPLINAAGEVVAIMQPHMNTVENVAYAVSVKYPQALKISGLSLNEDAYKKTSVKLALPDDQDQAILTLYIAEQVKDSASYAGQVEDFIAKFPNASDGYISRARLHERGNRFAEADKDMEMAIEVAEKKDDAHYNYARLITAKQMNKPNVPYGAWTFDKAVDQLDKAYAANPVALYLQTKAQIRFSEKRYSDAYDVYARLTNDGHRTAEIFYEAAQCKQMLGDTTAVLSLLDSCVNTFSKPYLKAAAPYIYARAKALDGVGEYRRAVNDYNEFEKLLPTEVNANFYYLRAQAEINGRLYQQAVNDFKKAVSMAPDNIVYLAEKASLEVRLGLYDDAIVTANDCIKVNDKASDGYLFLGLAQCLKGNKTEGKANLEKALELGDEQAKDLIEKYAQ